MKIPPQKILEQARMLGLTLTPKGGQLAVCPSFRITPNFDALIKENIGEVMAHLEKRWLYVARQILDGEWDSLCDGPRREHLTDSLKSVGLPVCDLALARLAAKQDHRQSCGG
jgi:hypothetical protein